MRLSRERLQREAATTGFRVEILEKVAHLLELLDGFNRHPYMKGRLALKGGTALNLFVFDAPRLSIDIDVNYVGQLDREAMLAERPEVERALEAVCGRADIAVERAPGSHAGGKWRLRYESAEGQIASLELDINYMLRAPLWNPTPAVAKPVGTLPTPAFPILDIHELAAGKLAALLARQASRRQSFLQATERPRQRECPRHRRPGQVHDGQFLRPTAEIGGTRTHRPERCSGGIRGSRRSTCRARLRNGAPRHR